MGGNAPRYEPPFSEAITKTIAIPPKFLSVPSIIGAVFVMQDILRSPQRRRRVYHRIMVGMSSMDLLWAIKMLLGTWLYPPDPWGILYGAHGTEETCTFNGFLAQSSSLSSVLYSGSLTLFFLFSVRFGWREGRFRRCYVEPCMHLFPLVIGWGTAFLGLGLQLFNPWTCWIQAYPPGCT